MGAPNRRRGRLWRRKRERAMQQWYRQRAGKIESWHIYADVHDWPVDAQDEVFNLVADAVYDYAAAHPYLPTPFVGANGIEDDDG